MHTVFSICDLLSCPELQSASFNKVLHVVDECPEPEAREIELERVFMASLKGGWPFYAQCSNTILELDKRKFADEMRSI